MLDMPFVTRWPWVLALFIGEVAALHTVLWLMPAHVLSKKRWAQIEYLQVALAALGLLGAVSQVRQMMAQNLLASSQEHIQFDFDQIKSVANDYATPGIMMCLKLQSGPASPPDVTAEAQKKFDAACDWITDIVHELPTQLPAEDAAIQPATLTSPPPTIDDPLFYMRNRFEQLITAYNHDAGQRRQLRQQSARGMSDQTMLFFAPFALSLALALKTMKVTADLWAGKT